MRPDDVVTLVRLAEAQLSAGDSEAADRTLSDGLKLAPQHARILGTLGRVALARRDYASAISRLEEALRVDPQATALHYQLSLAYRGAGDTAKAEEARKAKYSGTVILYIEVDQTGHARNLRIVKGIGLGLDEKAIEAVNKWRFKPGLKDGKPVVVAAHIEVNFRLL